MRFLNASDIPRHSIGIFGGSGVEPLLGHKLRVQLFPNHLAQHGFEMFA